MGKLLIISNRLPVSLIKEGNTYTHSSGGLATSLASVYQKKDAIWVGWPGMEVAIENQQMIAQDLACEKMHLIFLSQKDTHQYYEGFSNATLWPLFHYFPWITSFEQDNWEAYIRVNEQFCEQILELAHEADTIWIHDFHLFLLPSLLRKKLSSVSIGFFLHIPFPSYEVFRILPWREELLYGMLGADLIGFQTSDDSHHFLSAVKRLINVADKDGYLVIGDHLVKAAFFPISIDYTLYEGESQRLQVIDKAEELRQKFLNRNLFLSVDRLDLSKGIPEKLRSYEIFLTNNPDLKAMHHLLLLVVPSRIEVDNYIKLKWQIEQEVGRINGKFGDMTWTPIHYMFTSLPLESLSALYKIADVALVTPLRDGMNLVAKEYIASKADSGVLILSEMAGAAKELTGAIIVNPFDCNKVAKAIELAICMPQEEQLQRIRLMQQHLKKHDVHQWAKSFLEKLQEVKQEQLLPLSK